MNGTITSNELDVFLKDYEKNTNVSILEGNEKDEIIAIAKAKGILLKDSRDLAGIKCIYTFPEKVNKRGVRIPHERLVRALPTAIGKNIDIDHIRRYTIGYICDIRYSISKKQVIVYGIVFKSVFKDEWNEIKKAFKNKALTVSSEIWHPKERRKYLGDGSYELGEFEFAGMGVVFNTIPLFSDAKVLEFASMEKVKGFIDKETYEPDLIFASVKKSYDEKDLIIASTEVNLPVELPTQPVATTVEKTIKCSLCGTEINTLETTNIKCPNCLAIIDETGKVLFPPQIKDFNIRCPNCNIDNWLVEKRDDTKATILCNSCLTRYNIVFVRNELTAAQKLLRPLYSGQVYCLQCDTLNYFTQIYTMKKRKVTCTNCKLTFDFDIESKIKKQIKEITKIENKIKEPELIKASIEGGKGMLILSKYHRVIDTPNFGKLNERLTQDYEGMEIASKLNTEDRDKIMDSKYAVVIRVRDKSSGKIKKIRKYPIHDAVHIRNSWVAINQESAKDFFITYGASLEKAKTRIERASKELGADVKDAIKDYEYDINITGKDKLVKKAVKKIRDLKKSNKTQIELQVASMNPLKSEIETLKLSIVDLKKTIEEKDLEVASTKKFYMDNSALILERIEKLGEEYLEVASIEKEKLVDNDYFDLHRLRKQEGDKDLAGMEVASKVISNKTKVKSRIELRREQIDRQAFPEKYK